MMPSVWDMTGIFGSFMVIAAYFSNQQGWVESKKPPYLVANLVGALLIIVSLLESWNLPSLVIEVFWILISAYGIVRHFRTTAQR